MTTRSAWGLPGGGTIPVNRIPVSTPSNQPHISSSRTVKDSRVRASRLGSGSGCSTTSGTTHAFPFRRLPPSRSIPTSARIARRRPTAFGPARRSRNTRTLPTGTSTIASVTCWPWGRSARPSHARWAATCAWAMGASTRAPPPSMAVTRAWWSAACAVSREPTRTASSTGCRGTCTLRAGRHCWGPRSRWATIFRVTTWMGPGRIRGRTGASAC